MCVSVSVAGRSDTGIALPPLTNLNPKHHHHNREFTTEPAVDSVVQTTLDARQQEMANFEGFTYDDRAHKSRLR